MTDGDERTPTGVHGEIVEYRRSESEEWESLFATDAAHIENSEDAVDG
ncbi:hypothetical protein GJR96_09315 [Haloferax sp. MBLA0076]|uniref:Uncharacterized protein n=1 Tax=Haloferax litoreum TaxID=2666140 RepID=A0A6A8GI53_9EURY|nr:MULTISPECIES: hypothetical protein [Haloferax]MRX22152.1 hypothetical protein [Haloferax litoreum]